MLSNIRMSRAEPNPGRAYGGRSRDERRRERHARLVAAAVKTFGGHGYHSATVRSVCAAAGLTERYFYESFANNEALLIAAYQDVVARLQGNLLQSVAAGRGDPEATVRAALRAYFQFVRDEPEAARILLFEVLGVSHAVDALYRKTTQNFGALLIQVTRELYQVERIPGLDEELFAAGLVGAAVMMGAHWMLAGHK